MRFASPAWLWLLALLPLLALGAGWAYARRAAALRRFAGGEELAPRLVESVSVHRRAIKVLLLQLALGALIVAAARPQWGTRLEPVTRTGADVVVVLDTSLSMSAEDLTPSRLTQAKHAVGSLLDRLAGDRVALVTFAGQARRNCPLTVDHGAVRLFLDSLQPDAVAVPGTALADALRAAAAALRVDSRGMDDRGRAIVLLSDGEDHEGDVDTVLTELERSGIPVYALGFGTPRGAPIPLRDAAGLLAGYKRDAEDKVVTTRLAEEVLERVALETRGRYWRATAGEEEVEEIGRSLGSLSRGEIGADLRSRYEERFRIPLLLAWLALVVETVLGDRRRGRRTVAEPAGRQVV